MRVWHDDRIVWGQDTEYLEHLFYYWLYRDTVHQEKSRFSVFSTWRHNRIHDGIWLVHHLNITMIASSCYIIVLIMYYIIYCDRETGEKEIMKSHSQQSKESAFLFLRLLQKWVQYDIPLYFHTKSTTTNHTFCAKS